MGMVGRAPQAEGMAWAKVRKLKGTQCLLKAEGYFVT